MSSSTHYDQKYFDWQKSIGEFGGWANRAKFEKYVKSTDVVLDFGCGGGYLAANLKCAKRLGIEVNPNAAAEARTRLDEVYEDAEKAPSNSADVIISNSALEHVLHPLKELENLRRILKPGGKIILVVPCEGLSYKYKKNDINFHLYSWSPMNLGNLLTQAGFNVESSEGYIHKWPPGYIHIAKLGRGVFNLASRIYARLETTWFQVHAVAQKPLE